MTLIDFDDYLKEKIKDPEFKKLYEKEKAKLEWIFDNVKGAKKQWLIEQITDANEKISMEYLNTLRVKKLINLARYYKINILHYYW